MIEIFTLLHSLAVYALRISSARPQLRPVLAIPTLASVYHSVTLVRTCCSPRAFMEADYRPHRQSRRIRHPYIWPTIGSRPSHTVFYFSPFTTNTPASRLPYSHHPSCPSWTSTTTAPRRPVPSLSADTRVYQEASCRRFSLCSPKTTERRCNTS